MLKFLNNVSLERKIILFLGPLVLACLVLGGIAVVSFLKQEATVDMLVNEQFQAVDDITEIQAKASLYRQILLAHVAEQDQDKMLQFREQANVIAALIPEQIAALQAKSGLFNDADQFLAIWDAFVANGNEIMEAGENFAKEEATEAANTTNAEFYSAATAYIDTKVEAIREQLTQAYDVAIEDTRQSIITLIGVLIAVVAVIVADVFLGRRIITKPMNELVQIMQRLSDNQYDTVVTHQERRDEIGTLAKGLEVFKENGQQRLALEEKTKQEHERQNQRTSRLEELISGFESIIAQVINSVSSSADQLQATANDLTSQMGDATARSTSVSAAAEQTSQNVQQVASATEQLSVAIVEVSNEINRAAQLAQECNDDASISQQGLADLQASIGEIDQVIIAINDVAEKTNLLALNATIEAARAGEAGRGFSVVASEVKQLASQTHNMTGTINTKVELIKSTANSSIERISKIIDQINNINASTTTVAASLEEQTMTVNEVSRNLQQAAQGTTIVSNDISEIQNYAQSSNDSSIKVKEAAESLAQQFETLKDDTTSFLESVRAV